MTRRPTALATSVAALLSFGLLSSCSSFDDSFAIASVGDHELSDEEFEAIARNPAVLPATADATTVPGDTARSIIGAWVNVYVLEDAGALEGVTDEQARAYLDSSPQLAGWDTGDEAVQFILDLAKLSLLIENGAIDPAEANDFRAAADVHVASRYGAWDPARGVLPLGPQPE